MSLKERTNEQIEKWLDGPTGREAADKAAHWGVIAAGAGLSWVAQRLGPIGVSAAAAELVNAAASVFTDPNIEGIPIKAEFQRTSRDIDVSMQMLVSQGEGDAGGKDWVTDNAAPRPRQWTIRGYLQSLSNIVDGYFIVKPTLLLQLSLLDGYAASRRPVWFKAHYSLFYRVLIEHFDFEFDPKAQNAVTVNLTLLEYTTNIAYSGRAGRKDGTRVQDPSGTEGPLDNMDLLDDVTRPD